MDMQVFNSPEGQEIRVIDRDGDPWFVAADVCRALEIANPRDAVSRLDDDEKGVGLTDMNGKGRDTTIIAESGLYSLIFKSRKPEAKTFKRWVTHDVLPQIRRTGTYQGSGSLADQIDAMPLERLEAVLPALRDMARAKRRLRDAFDVESRKAPRRRDTSQESALRAWVARAPERTTMQEALAAVGLENNRANQTLAGRVILASGYHRRRLRDGGDRMYVYVKGDEKK